MAGIHQLVCFGFLADHFSPFYRVTDIDLCVNVKFGG